MKQVHLICEFCQKEVLINKNKYASHVQRVHHIELPDDYDLEQHIQNDLEKVSKHKADLEKKVKERQKRNAQKNKIKAAANKAAQKDINNNKPPAIRVISPEEERYLVEMRRKEIEAATTSYLFIWDDFEFERDFLRVNTTRHKQIFKPLPLKGSIGLLNQIKAEYFNRLFRKQYRLYFYKAEFQEKMSKDWERIKETIEGAIEYAEFKLTKTAFKPKFGILQHLTSAQLMALFSDRLCKSVYLKCLAEKQDETLRIVPIIEYQNKQLEESFLFRLRTNRGRILIVWENVKEGRATHLFITDASTLQQRLTIIESFIIDTVNAKRIILYEQNAFAKKLKADLGYIGFMKHSDILSYQNDINSYIANY